MTNDAKVLTASKAESIATILLRKGYSFNGSGIEEVRAIASKDCVVIPADKLAELEAEMRDAIPDTYLSDAVGKSELSKWADRLKKLREGCE